MHGVDEIVNAQYREQPKGQSWGLWYLMVFAVAVGFISMVDLVFWQSFLGATFVILVGCGLVTWARIRTGKANLKSSESEST